MSTFRLVEFEFIPSNIGAHEINGVRGYKQIANIFEHDTREKLIRFARKNGVKIRGNKLVEIQEFQDDYAIHHQSLQNNQHFQNLAAFKSGLLESKNAYFACESKDINNVSQKEKVEKAFKTIENYANSLIEQANK